MRHGMSEGIVDGLSRTRTTWRRSASLWMVATLASALLIAWAAWWWRGRPERHLGEARFRLETGAPGEAASWLDLPEATPATRDRALLLRARVALARHRPA